MRRQVLRQGSKGSSDIAEVSSSPDRLIQIVVWKIMKSIVAALDGWNFKVSRIAHARQSRCDRILWAD